MSVSLREIEDCAFAAWPAEEVRDLGGWRLRYTRGVTRRANSVWPCAGGDGDPGDLTARIAAVEAFYAERGAPALFQLSPLATPAALDRQLAARGYASEAAVAVHVADSDRVGRVGSTPVGGGQLRLVVERQLFPAWFEISGRRGRFAESGQVDVYQELLARLSGRALYALAEIAGEPAAVGLGVAGGGWLGIFSMTTLPAFRRRGAGRAVLSALAEHARQGGIERVYLQVERDNAAARALYTGAGFSEAYGYHYRRRATTAP